MHYTYTVFNTSIHNIQFFFDKQKMYVGCSTVWLLHFWCGQKECKYFHNPQNFRFINAAQKNSQLLQEHKMNNSILHTKYVRKRGRGDERLKLGFTETESNRSRVKHMVINKALVMANTICWVGKNPPSVHWATKHRSTMLRLISSIVTDFVVTYKIAKERQYF